MRSRYSFFAVAVLLGLSVFVVRGQQPEPPQWGTVKGRVVWTDKVIPKNPPIPGAPPRLMGGPILKNSLVVNAQNRGVRWVLVWLADPKDARNAKFAPPIHPSLTNPPPSAEIDSPNWEYEPRVRGLWTKQSLRVKNSGTGPSTFLLTSMGAGPMVNTLIPPGGRATVKGFAPKLIPTPYSCGVNRWMKGYVGTFAHPYFAVTDDDGNFEIKKAPAGKFQLIIWHESTGFVTMTSKELRGKVIQVKGKGVTDVGNVGMKKADD